MSTEDKVRRHFDADAERFDAIYDDTNKGLLGRFIDNVWRGVVRRRFDLVLEKLAPFEGRTFLDVGCGSGRYCLAYAQRGATRVVGVDFAARMIELANAHGTRLKVADRCDFRVGFFPDAVADGPFDAASAMGFFDYVPDPARHVRAMKERTRHTMVMSFPKAWEWRAPIRRLRFLLAGTPLFLYTEKEVRGILHDAGVVHYDFISFDRDIVIIAKL